MTISKEKVEKAILLKQGYARKLSESTTGKDKPFGHEYQRGAEARCRGVSEFEASQEFHLFKEFLEGLAKDENQNQGAAHGMVRFLCCLLCSIGQRLAPHPGMQPPVDALGGPQAQPGGNPLDGQRCLLLQPRRDRHFVGITLAPAPPSPPRFSPGAVKENMVSAA